jgi:hypothetical protein
MSVGRHRPTRNRRYSRSLTRLAAVERGPVARASRTMRARRILSERSAARPPPWELLVFALVGAGR